MEPLIIFVAKYLILLSPLLTFYFWYQAEAETRKDILAHGLLSLPFTYILGLAGRYLYDNPRPFTIEGFEPLIKHAADNGFPSDHTLLLAALAALVTLFDRRWGTYLWVITVLVGLARVTAGVHHLADIISSILIALVATGLVYFVLKRIKGV